MGSNSICGPDLRRVLISRALDNVTQRYEKSKFFERPLIFFLDEIGWILSHGIENEEQYIAVERVGRVGTTLARRLRGVMFEILKEYLALRGQEGKLYDWDDIAYYVHQEYLQDDQARRYRHIIIDEGQDFSPEMIRSLASAIPEDGSLTFFGDVAQQIYGQRTSWRFAGPTVPQTWEFKENYRNTKQVARLGLAISKMPFFEGIADIVEPTPPRADGPSLRLPNMIPVLNRSKSPFVLREIQAKRRVSQFSSRIETRSVSSAPACPPMPCGSTETWTHGMKVLESTMEHIIRQRDLSLILSSCRPRKGQSSRPRLYRLAWRRGCTDSRRPACLCGGDPCEDRSSITLY